MGARPTLLEIAPRPEYRLWLRYADGNEGEVDLSHLVGVGVFSAWDEPGVFDRARIGPSGDVRWGDEIELCPDALYLQLTRKSVEEAFPLLKGRSVA